MKYNPKINEWAARLPALADSHPLDPEPLAQGSLELQWLLASCCARSAAWPRSASSRRPVRRAS